MPTGTISGCWLRYSERERERVNEILLWKMKISTTMMTMNSSEMNLRVSVFVYNAYIWNVDEHTHTSLHELDMTHYNNNSNNQKRKKNDALAKVHIHIVVVYSPLVFIWSLALVSFRLYPKFCHNYKHRDINANDLVDSELTSCTICNRHSCIYAFLCCIFVCAFAHQKEREVDRDPKSWNETCAEPFPIHREQRRFR